MKLVRIEVSAGLGLSSESFAGSMPEHVINLDAVVEVYVPTGGTLKQRNEVALLMANRTTLLLTAREWRRVLRVAGEKMPPSRTRPTQ